MDSFQFDFDTDSTMTNDTNSNSGDLDWSAFQSAPPTMSNGPFSPIWFAQQDDAVAPDNRTNLINSDGHDDGIYSEIEHFFNGLNQQNPPPLPIMPISLSEQEQDHLQPIHVNLPPTHSETTDFDTTVRLIRFNGITMEKDFLCFSNFSNESIIKHLQFEMIEQ